MSFGPPGLGHLALPSLRIWVLVLFLTGDCIKIAKGIKARSRTLSVFSEQPI